jgi:tetratricopeptide (TPR) repeat protein
MQDQPARVGLDPVRRVFLLDNHDEAYRVWREAGAANRILVHVDAHHDMWWADDLESITIANFLSLALKDDLVREIFWVVPDLTWRTDEGRQAIRKHVRKIVRTYPGVRQSIREDGDRVSTRVLGKPLTICALDGLPRIDEVVFLDIDVDFLVIPRVSFAPVDEHARLPWCWPDDLVSRLCARGLRTDLATVVRSVDGGYTPLKWKYLGDELALRLENPDTNGVPRLAGARSGLAAHGMTLIREGAEAADRGDIVTAEQKLELAARVRGPVSAAAKYHLANLYRGRIEDARALYRQALADDPSYRSAHANAGFNDYRADRLDEAEREFHRALSLDPEHPLALLGLGLIAVRRTRWSEAEALLRRALASDGTLIDAHRRLAEVLVRRGECDEAIASYERSLTLAMAGQTPLGWLPATDGTPRRLLDVDHWKTHAQLARLYERKGHIARAIAGYRMSVAAGHGGAPLRKRLARLSEQQQVTAS